MARRLNTLPEVMDRTGLGKTSIYEEMKKGRLRYVQYGSKRLVTDEAIDDFIALLEGADSAPAA